MITFLIGIIINLLIGGWSVYEILSWFNKEIPFGWSMVIGLLIGEVTIPVAIVGKILRYCKVF